MTETGPRTAVVPEGPRRDGRGHWPPKIGSARWHEELGDLGLDRRQVRTWFRRLTKGFDWSAGSAHDVGWPATLKGSPELQATFWVLFHQRKPAFASLMFLGLAVHEAKDELRSWSLRQLASMIIHGPGAVTESALYYLWCGDFEVPKRARRALPRLFSWIPVARWGALLEVTGPVEWDVKLPFYEVASSREDLHVPLAKGLIASFVDAYGQVDAVEAHRLWKTLRLPEGETAETLRRLLDVRTPGPGGVIVTDG